MIEIIFEFSLSAFENTYLLWFYLTLINQKWKIKNLVMYIILMSCIQFAKDSMMDFGGLSSFVDCFIAVVALYLVAFKKNTMTFLSAIIIYSIDHFSVICFVSIAIELSIDVASTLIFGLPRIIFCLFLKSFTILLFMYLVKPLKKLREIISYGAMNLFSIILAVSMFCLSYVYGNSQGNEQIFIYTAFLTVILLMVYYLFYLSCDAMKRSADAQMIAAMMELTTEQTHCIQQEHEEYRKIKHDLNNQLSVLYSLQKQGQYKEVESTLAKLCEDSHFANKTITSNLYIDAVFRQKMKQFEGIEFHLDITLSKDFEIEGKDVISLLSNIIDNGCEELIRIEEKTFDLKMKADKSKMIIYTRNKMRKNPSLNTTDKDKRYHGYGLKIIKEIVEKYNGVLSITTGDYFEMKITMML